MPAYAAANRREDEKTSDVIRRALRLLDREAWERARADMHRLTDEDCPPRRTLGSTTPAATSGSPAQVSPFRLGLLR
jgi:hypothetical protein